MNSPYEDETHESAKASILNKHNKSNKASGVLIELLQKSTSQKSAVGTDTANDNFAKVTTSTSSSRKNTAKKSTSQKSSKKFSEIFPPGLLRQVSGESKKSADSSSKKNGDDASSNNMIIKSTQISFIIVTRIWIN